MFIDGFDRRSWALCHPSRESITGRNDQWSAFPHPAREFVLVLPEEETSIPVDDDNVFSPRPEYVPTEKEDVPTLVY